MYPHNSDFSPESIQTRPDGRCFRLFYYFYLEVVFSRRCLKLLHSDLTNDVFRGIGQIVTIQRVRCSWKLLVVQSCPALVARTL